MIEQKSENMMSRVVFALFLVMVFSLGVMKPAVFVSVATLTPTDLIFPLLFLGCVVALVSRRMSFVWHPVYWSLIVYVLALAVSAVFSQQPRLSFAKLAGEIYLVLLPVIAVNVITDVTRLRLTVYAWLAGAIIPMLVGLVGIGLYYFFPGTEFLSEITYHYGAVPVGPFPRINSTFVSPSMFCNYLTVTFVIVVACRWLNWISPRVSTIAFVAPCILCLAFTYSIALGGFFLAGGLLVWNRRREAAARIFGLSLAIVNAIAFIVISPFSLPRPDVHYNTEHLVLGFLPPSSRLLVWSDASQRFIENPIVGSGVGTAAANVLYVNTDGTLSLLTDAHNMFLNVAVQAGVIGLIALLLVIWSVLRAGLQSGDADLAPIRIALLIAFIAAFLYDGLTGSFENARHLWVLIGLILAINRLETRPKPKQV